MNKQSLIKNLEDDITYNFNLQNSVRKDYNIILTVVILLINLAIAYYTSWITWLASSLAMWGLYSIYSIIEKLVKHRPKIENLPQEDVIINSFEILLKIMKPFLHASTLFFLINLLIVLFIDTPFRVLLIIFFGIQIFFGLIFYFSDRLFIKGMEGLTRTLNPARLIVIQKNHYKKILAVIFILFVLLVIVLFIVVAPFFSLYVSYTMLINNVDNITLFIVLIPVQFILLFLVASYLASNAVITELTEQNLKFKNMKDELLNKKISKKRLGHIINAYRNEKKKRFISTKIIVRVWLVIYSK